MTWLKRYFNAPVGFLCYCFRYFILHSIFKIHGEPKTSKKLQINKDDLFRSKHSINTIWRIMWGMN